MNTIPLAPLLRFPLDTYPNLLQTDQNSDLQSPNPRLNTHKHTQLLFCSSPCQTASNYILAGCVAVPLEPQPQNRVTALLSPSGCDVPLVIRVQEEPGLGVSPLCVYGLCVFPLFRSLSVHGCVRDSELLGASWCTTCCCKFEQGQQMPCDVE